MIKLTLIAGMLLSGSMASFAEDGFKPLFNGKDLSGWSGNPKIWSVQEGVITGQTTPNEPLKANTFLIWTNGIVSDFELRCSFKLTPKNDKSFANSGIQYRSKIVDPDSWIVGGYQADMEAGPNYTGILYEERGRGILALVGEQVVIGSDGTKKVERFAPASEIQRAIRKNEWNDYLVVAKGNHIQHFINGQKTVDVIDNEAGKSAKSGMIAFQVHAGLPMMAQFKDVRLKTAK